MRYFREEIHLQKPDIAASLNWIGNDLIQLGEFERAKEQLNLSLEIRRGYPHKLMDQVKSYDKGTDKKTVNDNAKCLYKLCKHNRRSKPQKQPSTALHNAVLDQC